MSFIICRKIISESRSFTCLSCHPTDEMVLCGDSTGRVILWQNIFSNEKVQNVFHWHTLAVQTVSFSPSGSYFYSGGMHFSFFNDEFYNKVDFYHDYFDF